MDVHARNCSLHRAQEVAIIKRRKPVRQPALNTDFRGAELPSLHRFLSYLIQCKEISIGLTRAAAESAKLAADKADIGEINVAIDDIEIGRASCRERV